MASKAEAKKVRLECPLCLGNFKDATLLICGHTFCKGCLEEYDEEHNHRYHLVCPVCRQSTKLGPHRVSGLTPNFSIKGVEDQINVDVDAQKASYCILHRTVYNDIFCVDCRIFICLSCYIDTHKDHEVIKKEEMTRKLREKRDTLIKKVEAKKTEIQQCFYNVTQENMGTHRHLSKIEKKVKDTFARKVTILQENEEQLLKMIDDIRYTSDQQSIRYMTLYRQLMDNITSSMVKLTDGVIESSDPNTLQAYHLQCCEIENTLNKTIDIEQFFEPMVHLKQAGKSTRFCPADEKLLALGYIEQGLEKKNLEIVRKFDLSSDMRGMAALSQDAVVVGYGGYRNGADCFNVSGDRKPHLWSQVGRVYDIALLTDDRSVVSHDLHTLLLYDKQGNQIRRMRCPNCYSCPRLSSDQHDNIYLVNGTSQVFIFHGHETQKWRVVRTCNISPMQICVTKTGVMITSTCTTKPSTVTAFDREGHVGTSITASDDDEYLYAAVDSQDTVLIARMRYGSDTIGLTRYSLQGLTLTKVVPFNPLKLHKSCTSDWSYMVCLTPNKIAFANDRSLYFLQIDA